MFGNGEGGLGERDKGTGREWNFHNWYLVAVLEAEDGSGLLRRWNKTWAPGGGHPDVSEVELHSNFGGVHSRMKGGRGWEHCLSRRLFR